MQKIQIAMFRFVYQIDMKFDRQLRPGTETFSVGSYGGKTIPRWWTAAILKINISPYHCENRPPDSRVQVRLQCPLEVIALQQVRCP